MSPCIRTQERSKRCGDADQSREAGVAPAAIVLKFREDLPSRCVLACNPQDNHKDEEADDMNDHEDPLGHRKLSCTEDVESTCSDKEEHNEQRSLLQRIHTRIRIPQQYKPLHKRRCQLRCRRTPCNPPQCATPSLNSSSAKAVRSADLHPLLTNEIAERLLQRSRCELRHPMVLTTRRRSPKTPDVKMKNHRTYMELISAIDAIIHSAPTMTPTVTQITPAVPPFTSPYCAASNTLSHVDCSTMTKPTMDTKRKLRRSSWRLPMRSMSETSLRVLPFGCESQWRRGRERAGW